MLQWTEWTKWIMTIHRQPTLLLIQNSIWLSKPNYVKLVFLYLWKYHISFQTVDNSVHFIVNSRDAVVGWLCTLTFFFILIRRQFKCCNTRSRSDMLTYLRTTSIFTVSLHQARQYFMVKEKKAMVYGQQKATKESKKQTVKSFVRLRMQK